MKILLRAVLASSVAVAACGGGEHARPDGMTAAGGSSSGGAGGGAGGGGGTPTGGSGGSATGGSGGATAIDASTTGGGGGTAPVDASPPPSADASTPSGSLGWYEAEAVPPNQVGGSAKVGTCGAGACASIDVIKEGMECCSGGKKISNILGRSNSYLQMNGINAPADGMYDLTWWFHCGKNDNFGDTNCGGEPHTPSGCRPHQIVVNGTELPKTYHFPCFPGSWGEIHASTTSAPLKAGANTIRIFSRGRFDAADIDALQVFPSGKGLPPRIPMGSAP